MKTYTIKDFNQKFPTDDACLDFLFKFAFQKACFARNAER